MIWQQFDVFISLKYSCHDEEKQSFICLEPSYLLCIMYLGRTDVIAYLITLFRTPFASKPSLKIESVSKAFLF